MKYLKYFKNDVDYQSYLNSDDFVTPNVSYSEDTDMVYCKPVEAKETKLVCTYNVTTTTNGIKLCNNPFYFTSMEVDGVLLDDVTQKYTFDTVGEHIVKFELTDATFIVDDAFIDCSNLTSVSIPNSVTSIGANAFNSCSSLTSIAIPDSVTSIGEGAFFECIGLTSVNIPDSVTSIGFNTFGYCASLTSVNIPDSVTSIGEGAFDGCSSLTSINIPDSIISIGDYAFNSCSNLNEIICLATTPPSIGKYTFKGVKENGILKVPAGGNYSSWMSNNKFYLGYYNWTTQEI